ncbi:MAG: hypothetical protein M5U12_11120 [Verrucomicrobia bacterium]|nr:hypothetical protein [Verrucomicrobiota bacterium]
MNNKYRVTLNGFWCRTASRDNVGNWDGKGDEVMFVTTTRVVAPDGTTKIDLSSESEVHGDTWNLPNRVQAGSAWGGYGGIVTGDRFPTPTPWRMTQPVNTRLSPPYTLWEGDWATGGDSVFLSPTVWEWDDGTSAWEIYRAWLASTDSRFGKQAKEAYGTIWQAAKPIFDIVSIGLQTAQTMTGFWGLYKEARRPIGLARDPEDPDNAIFNPLVIGLNAESAEWLATNNLHGLGNGIVELRYADDPWLAGVYSLFIQISRVAKFTAHRQGRNRLNIAGTCRWRRRPTPPTPLTQRNSNCFVSTWQSPCGKRTRMATQRPSSRPTCPTAWFSGRGTARWWGSTSTCKDSGREDVGRRIRFACSTERAEGPVLRLRVS